MLKFKLKRFFKKTSKARLIIYCTLLLILGISSLSLFRMYALSTSTSNISYGQGENTRVEGDTVYLDDRDSDYNYYMGLNFTELSSASDELTGVTKGIYSDDNLVNVTINYDGASMYDSSIVGYVSKSERQSKYVYNKVYPIIQHNNRSYLKIELIDNPYASLTNKNGTVYAFYNWNINSIKDTTSDIEGSYITLDNETYTRYLYIPVDSRKQADITVNLNAAYVNSNICNFDGNVNNYNKCSLKSFGFSSETVSSDGDFDWENGSIQFYGNLDNYKLQDYYIKTSYNDSNKYLFYNDKMESCSEVNCGGTGYTRIGNKFDTEEGLLEYVRSTYSTSLTVYRFDNRDTNFLVLTTNIEYGTLSYVKTPCTVTSSADGSSSNRTINNRRGSLTLATDLAINNVTINTSGNSDDAERESATGSLFVNYNNFKLGRNIAVNTVTTGNGWNRQTIYRPSFNGIYAANSTNNNTIYRKKIIIESGVYNYYIAGSRSSNESMHSLISVMGNDYDRATNDNTRLRFRWSIIGHYYDSSVENADGSASNTFIVKSGKYGYVDESSNPLASTYDFYGMYIGGRGSSYSRSKSYYSAIQEGGEINHVIGGPCASEEHSNSGTYTAFYMKGGVAEYIFGGAGETKTYGNRVISITDGTVLYGVFGGSNSYGGTGTDGALSGSSMVYIAGNAQIGFSGMGTINNYYAPNGSVFGAGGGNMYDTGGKMGSVDNARIIIDGNAHIYGSVYGGGNYGSAGKMDISGTETKVMINSGTIDGNVFGSSNQNGSGVVGEIEIDESKSSNTYYFYYDYVSVGSKIPGTIVGTHTEDTTDGISEGTQRVFETYLYNDKQVPSEGMVCDSSNPGYVASRNKCLFFGAIIKPGTDISHWTEKGGYSRAYWSFKHLDSLISNDEYNATFYVQGTPVNEPSAYEFNWFIINDKGESFGTEKHTISVSMNGGTIKGSLYGGSDTGGTVFANISVNLNAGRVVNNVFGAGKGQQTYVTGNVIIDTYDGFEASRVYGGSEYGIVHFSNQDGASKDKKIQVSLHGGKVTEVYGGSKGSSSINPIIYGPIEVNVLKGENISTVYGGFDANGTAVSDSSVFVTGGSVTEVYGGSRQAGIDVSNVYINGGTVENVFGGSNINGVVNSSNVYILDGVAQHVYGGNNAGGTVKVTRVVLNGGTITDAYACGYGSSTSCDDAFILVNGIESTNGVVYGGGYAARLSQPSKVVVNKGTIGDVYGGNNYSGIVQASNVYVTNGTVSRVFGGNNQGGSTTTTNVFVGNGTINEIYGGSNGIATSAGTTNVHVYNGKINYVYGGGNESGANTSNVNVYGGTVTNTFGGSNNQGTVTNTNVNVGDESKIDQTDLSKTIFANDNDDGDDPVPDDGICDAAISIVTNELHSSDLVKGELTTNYSSNYDIKYFDIVATSSKPVEITDDDGIKLGGVGNLDYRSIKFEAKGSGTAIVSAKTNNAGDSRELVLYNASGEIIQRYSLDSKLYFQDFSFMIPEKGVYYISSARGGININSVSVTSKVISDDPDICKDQTEDEVRKTYVDVDVEDTLDGMIAGGVGTKYSESSPSTTEGNIKILGPSNNRYYKINSVDPEKTYRGNKLKTSINLYPFRTEGYNTSGSASAEIKVPEGAKDYTFTMVVSSPLDSNGDFTYKSTYIEPSNGWNSVNYNGQNYSGNFSAIYDVSTVTYYLKDSDGKVVNSKSYNFNDQDDIWQVTFDDLEPGKTYYLSESNTSNIYKMTATYKITKEMIVEVDGPITVTPEGHIINWKKVGLDVEVTWSGSNSGAYNFDMSRYFEAQYVSSDGLTQEQYDKAVNAEKADAKTYISVPNIKFKVTNPYDFDINTFKIKFYSKNSKIDIIPKGGHYVTGASENLFGLAITDLGNGYYRATQEGVVSNWNGYVNSTIPANSSGYLKNGDTSVASFTLFSKSKPNNFNIVAQWEQIWDYVPSGSDDSGNGGNSQEKVDRSFSSTVYESGELDVTNVYGGNNRGGNTVNGTVNLYNNSDADNVYGGGYLAYSDNGTVNINSGFNGKVYGGGKQAIVRNASIVNINGGVTQFVYGGGEKGDVLISSTVNLYDGTVVKDLFGSGNEANTGSIDNGESYSTVNLIGGVVQRDVYGGAYSQVVYGYTDVNVGAATVYDALLSNPHSDTLEIGGDIYGGGQTSSSGSDKMDFTFVSVIKGSYIDLDSTGNTEYNVKGSVFGSGNNSVVNNMINENAIVTIKNLGTSDNIAELKSIQRADVVYLENNYLQIMGDVDSTSDIVSARKLTFVYNRINNLHMIDKNELYLASGANMLLNLYSEYRDDDDNLQKEYIDIDVEKDEDGNVVLDNGVVKNNTINDQKGHNEIYMAKTKVLNVWQTQTAQAGAEGNVNGMAFLGMYAHDSSTNSIVKGIYDTSLSPKDTVTEEELREFEYAGTYVYGKHYTDHDITVDGYYTNYIDDKDALGIRVDYVKPTPESSTYYMWTIGVVSSKFEVELNASKYSTLGTAILPLTTFDNPDAEFWVNGVDTDGLAEGVNLTEKNSIKKVADSIDIANTTFSLTMDTGSSSLNGWKSTSSTDYMAINKVSGDTKYDADSTNTTPTLSFYLQHSKNVDYEVAKNDGDLGFVLIYMESRVPDPDDPTKFEVRNIEITVYMSIIPDGEDGYGSSITPGKKYSRFPTALTNITYNSSFSIYESLYINLKDKTTTISATYLEDSDTHICPNDYTLVEEKDEDDPSEVKYKCVRPYTVKDLYPDGSYRQLTSKMLFPVGTTITMIDLGTNKYYTYTVDNDNFNSKSLEYRTYGEVSYLLSDFTEISSSVSTYQYSDKEHNNLYYKHDDNLEYASEEFIFTVDFGNIDYDSINMRDYIVSNSTFYLELMSPEKINGKNKNIMKPISDDLGNMFYNIYITDFNGINTTSKFVDNTVYADQVTTLNVNTEIVKQFENQTVNNTIYDEYKLGAKITILDELGNQLDGSTLLGMVLTLGGTKYYPSIDGSFRVRLAENVTTVNSAIGVDIGNSNLTTGTYTFIVETFGSYDGIYNKSGEVTTISSDKLYVVNNKFGLKIDVPDVSITHDRVTGNDEDGNNNIDYELTTSSGLSNPNLRVSLQRRTYNDVYDMTYETVDLADYVVDSNVLTTTSIEKQYLVPNAFYDVNVDGVNNDDVKTKTLTYSLNLGENLKSGTYRVVFSVYDNDVYIGNNYVYLIIRDI